MCYVVRCRFCVDVNVEEAVIVEFCVFHSGW